MARRTQRSARVTGPPGARRYNDGMSQSNRPSQLPDVAADPVALARPLDWVGMDNIALPVRIAGLDG
jgi:hypothetical protein